MTLRTNAPLLGALLLLAAPVAAQSSLPIQADAKVVTDALATTGRATLQLRFTTETRLNTPYAVRVELHSGGRLLQRRDHAPPTPTTDWQADAEVAYDLPLYFPLTPKTRGAVRVLIGFLDPDEKQPLPPLTRRRASGGLVEVATFRFPEIEAEVTAESVAATVKAALELARSDARAAWDQLEFSFRRTDSYPLKRELQKALLQVGRMPPAELSFEEVGVVQRRIDGERARYLRQVAGRLYDRGRLFAALVLLDEVGGALQEDADRAVLGALDQARRVTKDRDGIAEKVFAITAEQKAEVDALVAQHKDEAERLAFGVELAKDRKRRPIARELVRTIEFTPELREEAADARRQIERAWLKDVPADQRKEADEALQHPCWARTTQRVSHRFVLIGPQKLLKGIPADSLLLFDLAYLYQTDLFGRVPNPQGDRVTVYFKELWEFGGGVGGGKIIDIGRADPDEKKRRVDGGLFYHELAHCVDDTNPIYPGFREGLADFAAAFTYHELGQVAQARAAIGAARRAFLGDYLERDLEYWRIPNYGPSAGFLLHFINEYGKQQGGGFEWQRYRRFFRDYRTRAVDDGRTPTLARAFAFHLVEAFGEAAFDDLVRFRWPLLPQDLEAIRAEQKAARRPRSLSGLDTEPGSPVPRDVAARRLRGDKAGVDDHEAELGVVQDWWVIGPFKKRGIDPDAFRFAPELEVDLKKRYESINNNPTWRRPGRKPVTVDPSGWLQFHFSYMDDSAIYALTHVTVEKQTETFLHVRGDDDVTVFVDDQLVGKYTNIGRGLGPWRPNWTVNLPDAARFRVDLQPGRHKVLLKVRNRTGGSGCTLAIAQRNGTPLPGWSTDVLPAKQVENRIEFPDGKRWKSLLKLKGSSRSSSRKLDATVGKWRVRNKAIEATSTNRGVEWRKYTVRPGFPKDSPSNLAWLPEKATRELGAFLLRIDLEEKSRAPKMCVTFQGDGMRDGLAGWTLILSPRGRDKVQARIERYDRLVYQSDVVAYESDPKKPTTLELHHWADRLTVRLGSQTLFDQAPIRRIDGRHRVGIATWGPQLRITEIELRAPSRTRTR
ncbi:MAG: hypothetical protein ACE37K_14890 [Planctomycetota bacterium]